MQHRRDGPRLQPQDPRDQLLDGVKRQSQVTVVGDEGVSVVRVTIARRVTGRCAIQPGSRGGTHRSWISPRTLPSGSVTVATRRPPPTSRTGSFTAAPAAVTSASFASMSGTCQ